MMLTKAFAEWLEANTEKNLEILNNTRVFKGTRLPIKSIGDYYNYHVKQNISLQDSFRIIRDDYPYLTEEDILCAAMYVYLDFNQ